MSFLFFEEILSALGQKLNFEAVSHYAGNSFCEKSWDLITESNPIHLINDGPEIGKNTRNRGLFDFIEYSAGKNKNARGIERRH